MSKFFRQVASSNPSQKAGTYIYTIIPILSDGVAAITSADELLLLDRQRLTDPSRASLPYVPTGVTCLIAADETSNGVLCAGREGVVAVFDLRSQTKVAHFESDRPVTALSSRGFDVAIGTELAHQQAIVSVWDRRQNKTRWQNAENNDDITDLHFHPSRPNQLLSGGVDGLLSIFDTNIAEEDDSLLQVVNHGSIHKAGFLNDSTIYALSHDENFSIHPVTSDVESDAEDGPAPIVLGDLRPKIPCEYVIDVVSTGNAFFLAAGTHSTNPHVDLVPIQNQSQLDLNNKLTLAAAHGDEIVRSLFMDAESETVFTAGEDGLIRAFREVVAEAQKPTPKSPKTKKASDARFRPY